MDFKSAIQNPPIQLHFLTTVKEIGKQIHTSSAEWNFPHFQRPRWGYQVGSGGTQRCWHVTPRPLVCAGTPQRWVMNAGRQYACILTAHSRAIFFKTDSSAQNSQMNTIWCGDLLPLNFSSYFFFFFPLLFSSYLFLLFSFYKNISYRNAVERDISLTCYFIIR